ncbi:MAG: type IV pilus assembly protein PilM [Candidatus Moranbacteria bacterium]|nr:type IV pilus assembly protein PilM [Candidatus Moranbacteria bacterium]
MGLFQKVFEKGKLESVGIDVGTSSIKAVHLDLRSRTPVLKNFTIARLKKGSIQTSNQIIAGKQISKILKFALKKSNIDCRDASFSVPNFSSFISFINIPRANPEQIPELIKREAVKFIPVPLGEVTLGWELLKARSGDKKSFEINDSGQMKILLMAIANDTIQKYETIAKDSKLNLGSIEPENFSLIRCLVGPQEMNNAVAILDIGSRICNILVAVSGSLRATRNVDVGGGDITNAIARGLGVDIVRSEALKKEGGLSDPRLTELISPVVGRIVDELKRVIKAYNQKNSSTPVQKVLTVGGTSKLKGFEEFLKKETGLMVVDGDPWSQISFSRDQESIIRSFQYELAVAIGIAMNRGG